MRIVNSDACQPLAISKLFHDPPELVVPASLQRRLDDFLQTLRKNRGPFLHVRAKPAFLRAHLIPRDQKSHERNTSDQEEDQSQAEFHDNSSPRLPFPRTSLQPERAGAATSFFGLQYALLAACFLYVPHMDQIVGGVQRPGHSHSLPRKSARYLLVVELIRSRTEG